MTAKRLIGCSSTAAKKGAAKSATPQVIIYY